jgi:transcriptional regulator with XRE-family HTH domain
MRKALRHAGLGPQQMADYLGVSRQSVGNWVNGRVEPSVQTVRLWAIVTGVSYRWLCHGNEGPHPTHSDTMQCLTTMLAAA